MERVLGAQIAMVLREPMTSLNPVYRTGWQVGEPLRLHGRQNGAGSVLEAVRMLARIGIPEPATALDVTIGARILEVLRRSMPSSARRPS